jgi:type VI protein secretion system component VasK
MHPLAANMRSAIMAQTAKKTVKATATRTAPAKKTAKATATRTATAKKTVKAPATRTGAPTKKSAASKRTATQRKAAVDRTAEMSDDVLKAVEDGQRAAIAAVRKFVDTVDQVIPALGDRPSRREQVIDAALDMADKLVTTQYDFLRSVVRSADRTLGTAAK